MTFSYRIDGCTLHDEEKTLIEEKISKLKKFGRIGDESTKVHVEVVRGVRHASPNYGVHIQITLPGNSLRAEASGKTIPDAVDAVEAKLRGQAKKLKEEHKNGNGVLPVDAGELA